MASPVDSEFHWIERVKSEGAVPLLDPDNCSNGWWSPPGDCFMVRGPDYLTTKVKIPGGEYLLKPLGFDWIKGSTKIAEVLKNRKSRVRKVIDEEFPDGDNPFVWAFNLQLPSKDNYSAVAYFVATEPIPEGSLMDQYLKGDDGELFEVDVDIGSSMVASAIVHLAFGYISMLTVDLAFVIEGQNESELPEQILGALRFSELNPASASLYEPPPYGSSDNLQSSLPTRLWKSIGQGFSQLLHPMPGAQENGSTSGVTHVNGTSELKEGSEDPKKW
ncbi:unnamed protein product [Dovyalis caffra]|uniref:Protein ENHANCED DISEASE RESISTANCE 2 C-terminal domain-containing protein n=1 Tax=Dovyalis caffra TaxID=77055 RepID=A0AAV1QP33_9ROSI|nr:unnamed protein product [Dovyalis caffra]